jgi:hypothetical protein
MKSAEWYFDFVGKSTPDVRFKVAGLRNSR